MKVSKAYTFDDLMLVPKQSSVRSRKLPSLETKVGNSKLLIPIISAPMNTVTGFEMSMAMARIGAGSVMHRYMSIADQAQDASALGSFCKPIVVECYAPWVAVGASGDYIERVKGLMDEGVYKFCVDVANGHSDLCVRAVDMIRKIVGDKADIMAGNVCTYSGAWSLREAGANIIRVGIGPGAMCTTRQVTGFGVPQLTAIANCRVNGASIVADGGIRKSGDIVKALAAGADAVMIGGMLAGTDETPGVTEKDSEGRLYKFYHGMASPEGRKEWFNKEATSYVPEGASTKVWHKGEAKKIVKDLASSVQVGMSFANAMNIQELQENAEWVEVSENGRIEGTLNRRMFK